MLHAVQYNRTHAGCYAAAQTDIRFMQPAIYYPDMRVMPAEHQGICMDRMHAIVFTCMCPETALYLTCSILLKFAIHVYSYIADV